MSDNSPVSVAAPTYFHTSIPMGGSLKDNKHGHRHVPTLWNNWIGSKNRLERSETYTPVLKYVHTFYAITQVPIN